SVKIEGRLKSAHYVAVTTQTYRAALDAAAARQPFEIGRQQEIDLAQSFSRGFSHGFLDGVNHQELVQGRFPKSRGVRIGVVASLARDAVTVERDPKLADAGSIGHVGDAASVGLSGGPAPINEGTQAWASLPLKPGDGVVFDEGHPEQDEQGGRVFEVQSVGRG